MMDKIKLFVYSDSVSANTGFGTVSHNLIKNWLATEKYEIHQLGINSTGDSSPEYKWENFYHYPPISDPFGRNRFYPLLEKIKPDLLFIINDYDACGHVAEGLLQYKEKNKVAISFVLYSPIDGSPIYPEWTNFIKRYVNKFVVVSKYAQEVIKQTDPTMQVDQVYHGVDIETFKKLPEEQIKNSREQLGKKFIVNMTGTNQLRKQYPVALEAFARFSQDKDDVLLFLHTQRFLSVGWNLDKLIRLFNLSGKVVFTEGIMGAHGIPKKDLNLVYNIADVFLNSSCGEGFCLPLIENMAIGQPIIYADNTSLSELVGDAGVAIPTDHWTIFPNNDRELIRPIPSSKHITDALNKMYYNEDFRKEMGQKAKDKFDKMYNEGLFNWKNISDYFDKEFDKLLSDKEEILDLEDIL